ncbi:MAG: hypothetical protein IV094_26180 [Vitreoscilla sp.]|nr:hypothetical protein [Vitreoscilla sp.]
MPLPILTSPDGKPLGDSVLLAVYAPFGSDETLSQFPDNQTLTAATHPLVTALKQVALAGTHVVALVDRVDDFTWLVDIPAGSTVATITSRWKQDMSSARNLAGFLAEAYQRHPKAALVLALEGHGAGYLPEIDRRRQTPSRVTDGGKFEWHFSDTDAAPVLPGGFPILPGGFPILPGGFPILPTNHMPLSTWGIGRALELARTQGAPRPAVIHFNNCFNMSVELLHTVAPHADYATGYINYNFFTSGSAYPAVFQALKAKGKATPRELATWFAQQNHAQLLLKTHHPTVAGMVELARMEGIATGVDKLSDAMRIALQSLVGAARQALVDVLRTAILKAQQYDSEPGWELEAPDQLTDLYSLAAVLATDAKAYPTIQTAAQELAKLLAGIKQYGDNDTPWLDETGQIRWDFSAQTLAMNIFLPDPLRTGQWDWRSPYYVDNNPTPPPLQPGVIEFLKVTGWVDFLVEYHKDVPFKSFHVGMIPPFPAFNAKYDGPRGITPPECGSPRKPWPLGGIARRLVDFLSRHGDRT